MINPIIYMSYKLLSQFYQFLYLFFCLFRATPVAHGSSQARCQTGAAASGLHHSHSNMGSEPCLRATPQLMATPDPQPTEQGWGLKLGPHGYSSDLSPLSHDGNSLNFYTFNFGFHQCPLNKSWFYKKFQKLFFFKIPFPYYLFLYKRLCDPQRRVKSRDSGPFSIF